MRRRRAERCLLRASAPLDADVPQTAEAVLAEAEALCPEHLELAEAISRPHSSNDPFDRATPDGWFQVLLALTLLLLFVASSW